MIREHTHTHCCTLSWLVSDPHTLVMFGKTSDHPADVQFLLMFPVREEDECQTCCVWSFCLRV